MADSNKTSATKAERLMRRALERLGSVVDNQLAAGNQARLSQTELGQVISRIEEAIESNLIEGSQGDTIAPSGLRVLLTYEVHTRLGKPYLETLSDELRGAAYEFINDRRYRLPAPLVVDIQPDLFARATTVVALSETDPTDPAGAAAGRPGQAGSLPTLVLSDQSGRTYEVKFASAGAPAYVGRAAGNAVRINDGSISRIHASLVCRASGEIAVADLNSANGTFVNGHIVNHGEARLLETGDMVCFGDVELTVTVA